MVLLALGMGTAAAIDNWLPYALLSHHNRAVEAEPEAMRQSGIRPEAIAFESPQPDTKGNKVEIRGWLMRTDNETKGGKPKGSVTAATTLIVLHSLGGTRQDVLKFSLPFLKVGVNLVLVDLRGHGESGGEFFTYGAHEAVDISGLIDELEHRGLGESVAVMGVSAGGAVAIAAAARDDRIDAVITLGTFADLEETIAAQTPMLPAFWRRRVVGRAEAIAQFEVEQASPIRNIAEVRVPVLLMHGDRDAYIPPENAEQLFEAAAGPKEIYWIEGGTHADMLSREGGRSHIMKWLHDELSSMPELKFASTAPHPPAHDSFPSPG